MFPCRCWKTCNETVTGSNEKGRLCDGLFYMMPQAENGQEPSVDTLLVKQ